MSRRARFFTSAWVAALLLLAIGFTFHAGSNWPFYAGTDFPQRTTTGNVVTHPAAKSATFSIYSPDARRMRLQTEFLADVNSPPGLQVAVTWEKSTRSPNSAVATTASAGVFSADTTLELGRGTNLVHLALDDGRPFCLESLKITRSLFTAGNLLFCLALAFLIAASILLSRALGIAGLDLFCSASLIAFLLVTSSATVLSYAHLLTGAIWAGTTIGLCLLVGVAAILRWRARPTREISPENTLRAYEVIVLLILILPIFLLQILWPISKWDDLMYHGSRTAYWMQNVSALPFISHDDRLSVFPMGGDLIFAWGTIISGSELPGKLMVFLAFPLCLFAMLALLKNAGIRSATALGIVAVFATTPLVFENAIGIKPDLWLVFLGIITLHWILAARRKEATIIALSLAAAGMGAALGVKWTAAPLLLLAFFIGWKRGKWQRQLLWATTVFLLSTALSGAGPILLANWQANHHPFGSRAMRLLHQPDPGLHPILVQLARLPFVLFNPPVMPDEDSRAALVKWEKNVASRIGAMELLRSEDREGWPGAFIPRVEMTDDRFSLSWLFVAVATVAAFFCFRKPADREKRRTFWLILGFSAVFGAAIISQTRWQSSAGLPERFLLPSLAFGLLAMAWPMDRLVSLGKIPAVLLSVLLVLHSLPFLLFLETPIRIGTKTGWLSPVNFGVLSEFSVLDHLLPPGRTILLVGAQGSRDYPLFQARSGFANRVLPWGKADYEAALFERAMEQPGIDTVIVVAEETIDMSWDPPRDARPFIRDLEARKNFQRLQNTNGLVVFLRKS